MTLLSDMKAYYEKLGRYDDPYGEVDCVPISDEITDTTRWSIVHEAIYLRKTGHIQSPKPLTFTDEYVRVTYQEPATEMQDWDDFDTPEVVEVEPVEVIKIEYRAKE
jgi:hypothetical protein